MTTTPRHLLLRRRAVCDSCYFVEPAAAARNKQINYALWTATTWRELSELLPAGEFDDLAQWTENGGEYIYDPSPDEADADHLPALMLKEIEPELIIRPEDAFSSDDISGVSEGDYPPFLELEQDWLLPREFCARFGKRVTGFTSGSWWEFPAERAEEMKSGLEALGFAVTIEIDDATTDAPDS